MKVASIDSFISHCTYLFKTKHFDSSEFFICKFRDILMITCQLYIIMRNTQNRSSCGIK